jgi:minichromosome maintenance protein 10
MSYSIISLWDVTQKPGAPNVLALTPESAASVAIIGTARDLGMCGVVKRDGKPCGSWFDKRVSDVCEHHVQHAVQRCRAGRPEFSAGFVFMFLRFFFPSNLSQTLNSGRKKNIYRTSGMGVGSGSQKRKAAYDPQRKWGLQPANGSVGLPSSSQLEGGEGPTYVVAGHIVAGGAAGKHDMFLKEKLGREAQARAAHQTNSHDTDVALKRLLARDKEGMRAVQEARKFATKAKAREKQRIANGKEVEEDDTGDSYSGNDDEEDDALADEPRSKTTKKTTTTNAYSARVIKELGFDPTVKSLRGSHGRRREEGDEEEPEGSRNEIYSKVLSVSSLSIIKQLRWCSFMPFFFIVRAAAGACFVSSA